jgi:hypothetical protein
MSSSTMKQTSALPGVGTHGLGREDLGAPVDGVGRSSVVERDDGASRGSSSA